MRGVVGVAAAAVFVALMVSPARVAAQAGANTDGAPQSIIPAGVEDAGGSASDENRGAAADAIPSAASEVQRDTAMSSWAFAGIDTAPPGPGRYLLFSSSDLWRNGAFTYGGVLWSPGGLDRDGLAVKLIFGGGLYRYVSGALGNVEVTGRQLTAAILPGWRFVRDKLFITVFAGPEFQSHSLSPDQPRDCAVSTSARAPPSSSGMNRRR
jgi:hypothetical protein